MIRDYKKFKSFIKADAKSLGIPMNLRNFVFNPIVRFTFLLRWNEYLLNTNKPGFFRLFWKIWFRKLSIKLGFSIPFNVFDEGLAIVHYGLLIVNPKAVVGKNCRVHAGVNIGGKAGMVKSKTDAGPLAPVIGDNCYLGPGAKIFGGITIGNNCVVGANAVVNKSFDQDHCTIGGIPAKVISEKGSAGLIIEGARIG